MDLDKVNGVDVDGEWFPILEGSLAVVGVVPDQGTDEWWSFRTHDGTYKVPRSKVRALRYPPNTE